jgi:hypothetical protein
VQETSSQDLARSGGPSVGLTCATAAHSPHAGAEAAVHIAGPADAL